MYCTRLFAAALTLALMVTAPAWAGPPLICHANDIGSARSLPWLVTDGWNGADPNYDLSHLTQDTLSLLGPRTPVVVRMETIRRAVIYATHRAGLAEDLEVAFFARTLNAQANGSPDPSALFDAGYLVETLRNGQRIFANIPAQQVDGLALMRKAQSLGGSDMEQAVATVERVKAEPHR
jgi:hypothetical protein